MTIAAAPSASLAGGEWPLVGRTGELRLLTGMLSRPEARGFVLAGPQGVGKTRLALEWLQQAERAGLPTARTAATRATLDLPFGAVAPLLPAAGPEPSGGSGADLLRRFAAALAERAGGGRLALLVDDAHLLDNPSAALIHQLAASGASLLLVTVRTGEPIPEPVVALWKDGLLDRLELGSLDGGAIDQLLGAVLGGPVDRATVARLAVRCQGNVLFLRELVLGALQADSLVCDGGLWRLEGPLAPSPRLVELVESRLASLGEAERALIEAVALAEPLGVAELAALADLSVAERLEREGLLTSRLDGRRLDFRLTHPLHGEVLRAQLSPLRSRAIAGLLADTVETAGARRREDQLRLATWRLDAGGTSPGLLLDAAAAAQAAYDLPLAERLARAALDAGAGFPAAVLNAQLASLAGRGAEAEAELVGLVAQASGADDAGLVAVTRIDNLRYMGRFSEALALAEEATKAVDDPGWQDAIEAKRAGLLLDVEGPETAAAAAEALRSRAGGEALEWACLISAFALGRTGALRAAGEAAEARPQELSAEFAQPGPPLPWPACAHLLARAEALAYSGNLQEAEALAAGEYERALAEGSVDAQAYAAWQLAKILLVQGRAGSAVRYGREGAVLLRQLGRRPLLRDCLVTLTGAEALGGNAGAGESVLAEIDALALPPSGWTGVDLLSARAWTAAAAGNLPAARELLAQAASLGERTGDRVGTCSALHDLARLGQAKEVAPRLAQVAAGIEGDLAPARVAHVAALARGDAGALEAASESFDAIGALLLAAEAAADAAVVWRHRGEPRAAAAAERRAGTLAERCEGAVTPALGAVDTRALLTPAEREAARLAAAGRSNKEIADELYLSVRTVENRLQRVYEKLGVSGRAELGRALEG